MASVKRRNPQLAIERRRAGLSQGELAEDMHTLANLLSLAIRPSVDTNYISRWERGANLPEPEHRILICLRLRLPTRQLGFPGDFDPAAHPANKQVLAIIDEIDRRRGRSRLAPAGARSDSEASGRLAVVGSLANLDSGDDVLTRRAALAQMMALGGYIATGGQPLDLERLLAVTFERPRTDDRMVLQDLMQRTVEHEGRIGSLPPGYLQLEVRAHLSMLQQLVRENPSLAPRLLPLASRTATVAAWLCNQMDNRGDAKALSHKAVALAAAANDRSAEAQAMIYRSSLWSQVPHGSADADSPQTLSLLDRASDLLKGTPTPLLHAWCFAWRAVEHAAVGETDQSDRDMHEAYEWLSRVTSREETGLSFVRDWDEVRLDAYRGSCAVLLGRSTDAIEILQSVGRKTGPTLGSRRDAVLGDLAIAYARQSEVERACEMLSRYLEHATVLRMNNRIQRARRVRKHLDNWHHHPDVQRLDDQFRAALDAAS